MTAICETTLTSSWWVRSSIESPSTGSLTMMPALSTTGSSSAGRCVGSAAIAVLSVMSRGTAWTLCSWPRRASAVSERAVA
ncbi:MAG: hypothetical protein K0Q46_932 [Rhodococcus erythropolis]|nr:hypothetical protein [Rhodococcus erythropolis]